MVVVNTFLYRGSVLSELYVRKAPISSERGPIIVIKLFLSALITGYPDSRENKTGPTKTA